MYAPLDFRFVTRALTLRTDSRAGFIFFLIGQCRIPPNLTRPTASHCRRYIIMDRDKVLDVLEDLIETCKDGQKGYQDAASHVKRSDLKTFFNEQSLERARFAGELQEARIRLGKSDEKDSGSVSAALHRAWIDTKVSMGAGDKAILESVEAGEDRAKEAYQKAMT